MDSAALGPVGSGRALVGRKAAWATTRLSRERFSLVVRSKSVKKKSCLEDRDAHA